MKPRSGIVRWGCRINTIANLERTRIIFYASSKVLRPFEIYLNKPVA